MRLATLAPLLLLAGCYALAPVEPGTDGGLATGSPDPTVAAMRQTGETLQSMLTTLLPVLRPLDDVQVAVPGAPVLDESGAQARDPETGEPLFTPQNTGLGGAALALLGLFLRGRRQKQDADARIDHERAKRKGVEDRVADLERLNELTTARNGGTPLPAARTS